MAFVNTPLQFQRTFGGPLDTDIVFNNTSTRLAYLTGITKYPGQIVSDLQDGNVYVLNSAGNAWVAVGSNTSLIANSANWNNSYTTLTANSANWQNTYTFLSAATATTFNLNTLSAIGTVIGRGSWANNTYTGVSGDGVIIDYLQGSPGLGRISVGNGTGADSLAFYSNGPGLSNPSTTMYLSSNGYVGINTATPNQVLTVLGTISASNTIYANGVQLGTTNFGQIPVLSANWNNSYTTLAANSAKWSSSYTTLCATSGIWNNTYNNAIFTLTNTDNNIVLAKTQSNGGTSYNVNFANSISAQNVLTTNLTANIIYGINNIASAGYINLQPGSPITNPVFVTLSGGSGGFINTSGGSSNVDINTNTNFAGGCGGYISLQGGSAAICRGGANAGNINLNAGQFINNPNDSGIYTGNGGCIYLYGGNAYQGFQNAGGNAGSILLQGGDGSTAVGNVGGNGGSIISCGTTASAYVNGGNGGTLNMSASGGNNGGNIFTYNAGGSIDTSGGGGSIITRNGGGSINTTGKGCIQLGNSSTSNQTFLCGTATQNRNICLPDTSGTLVVFSSNNSISASSFCTSNGTSNNWNSSYTTLTASSANWQSTYTTVTANSAKWNSSYTTLTANSANWQTTYTTVSSNSANWNTAYTLATGLTSISSTWVTYSNLNTGSFVKYTDINTVSGNWNTAYTLATGLTSLSSNWQGAYTWVNSNSANALHSTLTLASTALTASVNQPLLSIYGAASASAFAQIQNTANTLSASTDISIYNNLSNYLDIGINSSSYNGNSYYTGPFTITGPGDGYLYNTAGNLVLGNTNNAATSSSVIIFAGGSLSGTQIQGGNEVARFLSGGYIGFGTSTPNTNLTVVGTISASTAVYANGVLLGSGGGGGSTAGALLSTTTGTFAATGANVTFSTVSAANLSAAAFYGSGSEMVLSDGTGTNDTGNGANTLSLNFSNGTFIGGGGLNATTSVLTNINNTPLNSSFLPVSLFTYLTGNGSALSGPNVNTGIPSVNLAANGVYELVYALGFLKGSPNATLQYLVSASAPFKYASGNFLLINNNTGFTTNNQNAAWNFGSNISVLSPPLNTGALTNAGNYQLVSTSFIQANASIASTVILAISSAGGTITPYQNSYSKLTRVA